MRRHSGDLGVWPAIVSNNCDGTSISGGEPAPLRRAIRYLAVRGRRRVRAGVLRRRPDRIAASRAHSRARCVWSRASCTDRSTLGRSQSRGVAGRRSGVCMDHLMGGLEKQGRGARNALPTRRSAEPCSGRMIGDAERTPCRARNAIEIAASKSDHSQAHVSRRATTTGVPLCLCDPPKRCWRNSGRAVHFARSKVSGARVSIRGSRLTVRVSSAPYARSPISSRRALTR